MAANSMVMLMICIFAFIPLLLAEIAKEPICRQSLSFSSGTGLNIFPIYATVFCYLDERLCFYGAISYFYEQGPIYAESYHWLGRSFAVLFYEAQEANLHTENAADM